MFILLNTLRSTYVLFTNNCKNMRTKYIFLKILRKNLSKNYLTKKTVKMNKKFHLFRKVMEYIFASVHNYSLKFQLFLDAQLLFHNCFERSGPIWVQFEGGCYLNISHISKLKPPIKPMRVFAKRLTYGLPLNICSCKVMPLEKLRTRWMLCKPFNIVMFRISIYPWPYQLKRRWAFGTDKNSN